MDQALDARLFFHEGLLFLFEVATAATLIYLLWRK